MKSVFINDLLGPASVILVPMRLSRILLTIPVLLTVQNGAEIVYQGCYPESPESRQVGSNPGNYNTSYTNGEDCVAYCAALAYSYAGMTAGRLCFCGYTLFQLPVNETECDLWCTGNSADRCGSYDPYTSIYDISDFQQTNMSFQDPGLITTYIETSFTFNVTGDNNVSLTGTIDDDGPEFDASSGTLVYNVRRPGFNMMSVRAFTSTNTTVATLNVLIQAQTKVKGISVDCPEDVITDTRFDCFATVTQGTDLELEADMEDGTIVPLQIPDCPSSTVGQSTGDLAQNTSYPGNFLYVVAGGEFRHNGTVVGVSYTSTRAGTLIIQVYRPYCSTPNETFCHKSYSCIPSTSECYHQAIGEHWKYKCTAGSIYSIAFRSCVNVSSNLNTAANTTFSEYEMVGEIDFTITNVGPGFYYVPDSEILAVQAGDVLAVKEGTARLQLLKASESIYENYFDVDSHSMWIVRSVWGYSVTITASQKLDAAHAVEAYVVRSVRMKFHHIYSEVTFVNRTVLITAFNNVTSALTSWTSVGVHVPIVNISVEYPYVVATNDYVELVVPAHPGSLPEYSWDFGDMTYENTTANFTLHAWITEGDYLVTLVAENKLSNDSVQFIIVVQDPIENLTLTTEAVAATLGIPFLIDWDISQGTNVSYILDTGDGKNYTFVYDGVTALYMNDSIKENTNAGQLYHTYNATGVYQCLIIAYNLVSTQNVTAEIIVQIEIINFRIHQIPPISFGEDNIAIPLTVNQGVNMTVSVTFGNATLATAYIDDTNLTGVALVRSNDYWENGYYVVSGSVSNLVTPALNFTTGVWVDYPITNPNITIDKNVIATDDFITISLEMDRCSRFNVTVIFGDGSPDYFDYHDLMLLPSNVNTSHAYIFDGLFTAQIVIENPVDYYATSEIVLVQNPVLGFYLTSSVNANYTGASNATNMSTEITFELLFNTSYNLATNASYQIHYGDNSTSVIRFLPDVTLLLNNVTDFATLLTFSHIFNSEGNYSISVNIWNLVSQDTVYDIVEIFEVIAGLAFTAFDYDYNTKVQKLGGGIDNNYFAMEHLVLCQASLISGSGVTFDWDFGDGNHQSVYDNRTVYHQYSHVASYVVTLRASNMYSSANFTMTIYINKGCFDIAISSNSPRARNTQFEFSVYPGTIATDACYMIDFGDDDALPRRYQLFGDSTYCSTIPEWNTQLTLSNSSFIQLTSADWETKMQSYLLSANFTSFSTNSYLITNTTTTSDLDLNATASSLAPNKSTTTIPMFSSTVNSFVSVNHTILESVKFAEWNMTISAIMVNPGLQETLLQCKNHVSDVTVIWQTGVTKAPCWWPIVNLTKVNECYLPFCDIVIPGVRTSYRSERLVVYSYVRVNCTSTKFAYYWWRVFKQDDANSANTGNETEIIYLDNAEEYSIGGRNLVLEPRTLEVGLYRFLLNVSMNETMGMYSVADVYIRIIPSPLVVGIKGGDFVRRHWNILVPTLIDGTISHDPDLEPDNQTGLEYIWLCRRLCEDWPELDSDYNSNGSMPNNTCVYQDSSDRGCNIMDGVDSSGRFPNATGPVLEILTGEMHQDDGVIIHLIVRSGGREAEAIQEIYLTQEKVPVFTIACVTNCGEKVNPDSRFGLSSMIDGWTRGDNFYYLWTLYGVPENGSRYDRVSIDYVEWESVCTTGINGPNMAVIPGYFGNTSQYEEYYFSLKIWRSGTNASEYGVSEKRFQLNTKPFGGTVTVTPTSGVECDTLFLVEVSQLNDTDSALSFKYKFGFRVSPTDSTTWFYDGYNPSNEDKMAPLPAGDLSRKYQVDIIVRAYDLTGAFKEKWTVVQVLSASQSDVVGILTNVSEEYGLIDNIIVEADIRLAPVISCLANFLNAGIDITTPVTAEPSGNGTTNAESEVARLIREQIRERVFYGFERVNPATLEEVQTAASALATLAEKKDELSQAAQDSAILILDKFTRVLTREESVSADDREEAATTIIDLIGKLLQGSGYLAYKATEESLNLTNQLIQTELDSRKQKAEETVKQLFDHLDTVVKVTSKYKVIGESVLQLDTSDLTVTADKVLTTDANLSPSFNVGGSSQIIIPKSQTIFGEPGNETTSFIQLVVARTPTNFYYWGNDTDGDPTSDVIHIDYYNDTADMVPVSDLQQDFDIFIDREDYVSNYSGTYALTRDWPENMLIHQVTIPSGNALLVKLEQLHDLTEAIIASNTTDNTNDIVVETAPSDFVLLIKANEIPTISDFDFKCELPLDNASLAEMMAYMDTLSLENDASPVRSSFVSSEPDRWTCFLSNSALNSSETVLYNIGVKHNVRSNTDVTSSLGNGTHTTNSNENNTMTIYSYGNGTQTTYSYGNGTQTTYTQTTYSYDNSTQTTVTAIPSAVLLSTECSGTCSGGPQSDVYKPALYSLSLYTSYCAWWDFEQDNWQTTGCWVGPLTVPSRVHCRCNHLTPFAAGFAVPINTINFNNSAFLNLDSNPIVFATMVSMMCLYLLMIIWARRKDRRDLLMARISPLPDNDFRDKYFYEVTVYTGARKGAGTTSSVSLIVTGDLNETQPKQLEDKGRPILKRANVDSFLMSVPESLGSLTYLRIWHDNTGNSPSWYFSRMTFLDLQTGSKYYFICEEWLSLDSKDRLIDRIVPVAGKTEMTNFNFLFWAKAKQNLFDGHIWFSLFQRPAKSTFTRVQRLTCCLSLMFCAMCASIAWYGTADNGSSVVKLGPIKFSVAGIYVGVMSSIMTFPINLLIVAIFRYSEPPPENIRKLHTVIGNHRLRDGKSAHIQNIKREEVKRYLPVSDEAYKDNNYMKNATDDNDMILVANIPINSEHFETKKKRRLPHWCRFIGFAICFATVATAFWATVEIAGVFGRDKSLEWLISFFFAAFESIFLSQPLKVVLFAVFYALVIKKPDVDDDDTNKGQLYSPGPLRTPENETPYVSSPPDTSYLETIKDNRDKEIKMHNIIKEVIVCIITLTFVLLVAFTNRDPASYQMRTAFNNIFNEGFTEFSLTGRRQAFHKIRQYKDFWNWTENVFVKGLYWREWYNGDPIVEAIIQDQQSILVGGARLRQLRVKPSFCPFPVNFLYNQCEIPYSLMDEDTRSYQTAWQVNTSSDQFDTYFTYRSWQELDGYPLIGEFATYSGGGYIAELGTDFSTACSVVETLKNSSWIDDGTRAILVEFNLYNVNINLWGVSMYILEFLTTGGVEAFPNMYILRLDRYVGPFMYFIMAVEICSVLLILAFTVREIRKLYKRRTRYFQEFWNWWELISLLFAHTIIVLFLYRIVISGQTSSKIHSNPRKFTNLHHAVIFDELSTYFIAFLVFMLTIRFIRLLRINRKIGVLGDTLIHLQQPLTSFMVVFGATFLAFAMAMYILFGASLRKFRTFITTVETLLAMMLNKFDYWSMSDVTQIGGPVAFGSFALLFNILLINCLITVILEAFSAVRMDTNKQSNDYEIVDFMLKRLKLLIGIKPSTGHDVEKHIKAHRKLTSEMQQVKKLDRRVDDLLKRIEDLTNLTEQEKKLKYELQKYKLRRVVKEELRKEIFVAE